MIFFSISAAIDKIYCIQNNKIKNFVTFKIIICTKQNGFIKSEDVIVFFCFCFLLWSHITTTNYLGMHLLATKSMTCWAVSVCPGALTTKAMGSSPATASGTPMTQASVTPGWLSNTSSSTAGATCNKVISISHHWFS